MIIGASIRTLPTVKPRTYADKVGVVATVNDGEIGVLVNGRVVWFLEKEIEECQNSTAQPSTPSRENGSRTALVGGSGRFGAKRSTRGRTEAATRIELPRVTREASSASPDSPLSADSRGEEGREGQSVPKPVSGVVRGSGEEEQLILGERGPGGGFVARCAQCSGVWERERRRGRPSLVCPRCR